MRAARTAHTVAYEATSRGAAGTHAMPGAAQGHAIIALFGRGTRKGTGCSARTTHQPVRTRARTRAAGAQYVGRHLAAAHASCIHT